MKQRQYRGRRVDNKHWVYGWYVRAPQPGHGDNEHCMFDVEKYESGEESFAFCFRYVIPKTISQATGKTDGKGDMIFGGMRLKSTNTHIHKPEIYVYWCDLKLAWCVRCGTKETYLASWNLNEFEIIKE